MDCRETQALLSALHDGELPAADRAMVEEHLRGCPKCGELLDDLARADQAAGVPDPGPAYWDRFNARVMDRVEREADGPGVAVLRPKHGWMRQQLRYLVPAAAAAALVVVVVRYGGLHPGAPTPTVPPAVRESAAPDSAGRRMAREDPESRMAKKAEGAAVAQRVPPPAIANDRFATLAREERDRLADRSPSAGNAEASRDRAAAPAAISVPSSAPPMMFRGAPAASPPVTAADRMPSKAQGEWKKMADAAAPAAEPQHAAKTESASGMGIAKEQSAEAPPAVSLGKTRSKPVPSPLASSSQPADGQGRPIAGADKDATGSVVPAASPCKLARTLAAQRRLRESETAQRTYLAQNRSTPTQEKGLVFLAELLDRQARFADADAIIAEVDRQYPQSRPLDLYRQQRPMVQIQPTAVPVTR